MARRRRKVRIPKPRARRLKTLARVINEELDGFNAEIVEGTYDVSPKVPGRRIVYYHRTHYGNRLIVKNSSGEVVLDHNAADRWNRNIWVEEWIEDRLKEQKEKQGGQHEE